MCRLALKTADEAFSPYSVLEAMEAMKEGYDGSGLGLLCRGISFSGFRYDPAMPILSGIAGSAGAVERLDAVMAERGYTLEYEHDFHITPGRYDIPARHRYIVRVYGLPERLAKAGDDERADEFLATRLALRRDGEEHGGDLVAFSFWPDVVMIKEVGWPLEVGRHLGLDDGRVSARVVMAQGRQNTNWGINLYACHPFFLQGISTMTNGENTAFVPIREYLSGLGLPGYIGYESDSEVFTHILHYTIRKLGLPLAAYKHIITPLKGSELDHHPQGDFLKGLRTACRRLIIDGPNAVIGTLPDETCLLVMDHKKLRPATVGGRPGEWAFASEMCGIDTLVPDRDRSLDFMPMRENMVVVPPHRKEIEIWSQFDPLPRDLAA